MGKRLLTFGFIIPFGRLYGHTLVSPLGLA